MAALDGKYAAMRAVAAAIVAVGCSGSPTADETTTGGGVLSNGGTLRLALRSSPDDVPVRGENQVELTVVRADGGEPVEGLSLSMVPFMPAMGHGSPVAPRFSEEGAGQYRFEEVVLTMPGLWELRTTIAGPVSDAVSFRFDVR